MIYNKKSFFEYHFVLCVNGRRDSGGGPKSRYYYCHLPVVNFVSSYCCTRVLLYSLLFFLYDKNIKIQSSRKATASFRL